ncbi:MAG: AraC family transcriptional regulator, partial [Mangrovicoccus sp.]|nr:AraC family transcriptional regulator [Mangrovicoccus sp.]
LFALHVTPPLPDWSAEILRPDTAPDPTPAIKKMPVITQPPAPSQDQAAPAPRYARSGLGPEDLERLAARLEKRMREGKIWQDPMLNLKTLSEATGIQTMHLSEVLNTQLGQSFFDYVNGQRIDEACQRLGSSTETVLEISEAVGFNSKSTFNANFKRITGKTPTAWRAAMKAMLPEDRAAS